MPQQFYQTIELVCPYCGNKFMQQLEFDVSPFTSASEALVYCDVEETPGCGCRFYVEVTLEPVVKYFKVERLLSQE